MAYRTTTHSARDDVKASLHVDLTVGVKHRVGVRWVSPGGIMHRVVRFVGKAGGKDDNR